MREVNVTEARRSWSKLAASADKGEEIAITRRGKVVAWLAPLVSNRLSSSGPTVAPSEQRSEPNR